MAPRVRRVIVVGGGASALAAAGLAHLAGHDVVLLASAGAGAFRSVWRDGFLCERGPQAISGPPAPAAQLFAATGIADRIITAALPSRRKLLYLRGELRPVPTGPLGLLRSPLLSLRGKLRLACEPLVPRRSGDILGDESVFELASRRLGEEAAAALVASAVLGVYAGDARALSARSAIPALVGMEAQYGSLGRALLASRGRRPPRALVSFPGGLEELGAAIARLLGPRLLTARPASVAPTPAGWRVDTADGRAHDAEAVVLAGADPALLATAAPAAAAALRRVRFAPVAVIHLGFRVRPAELDLDAFGFLVARGSHPRPVRILGCQYHSTAFPGHAPAAGALLRVIAGGVPDPSALDLPDPALVELALADLRTVAGLRQPPDVVDIVRHPAALPQYEVGHLALVAEIDRAIAARPGLHVMGQALRGVGVADAFRSAAGVVSALA